MTRLGVTQMFLVPLMKPVILMILITLSKKTKKATKTIIYLIALSCSQHLHLMKPTSIPFVPANSLHLKLQPVLHH